MDLQKKVFEIATAVSHAGGRAFLVGGCVRDMLLGQDIKDYDLEVYGISAEKLLAAVTQVCEVDQVGMSFGVMKVRHYDIDIAIPRRENKVGQGHKGFIIDTDPQLDFVTAAARRDFTVNAIMRDALTGEFIDPHGGREDLKRRILRHVSPAFPEDPLRVLRGMQFVSRFGFEVHEQTVKLAAQLSQNELARERIAGEWEKMLLKGKFIVKALNFLRDCRWVKFYPELEALIDCPQNPLWHPEGDVWNHTLLVTQAAAEMRKNSPDDLIFMLAALCHDFGKPHCTVIESGGRITSGGHDTFTEPAEKFITAIWNRTDLPERVLPLIARHMHPWQLAENGSSDKAFRKLALFVRRTDLLADLAEADVRGIFMNDGERSRRLEKIALFRQRCQALEIADRVPEPLVLGRHLIRRGLKPGKEFKPLLDKCFEAQLEGLFATEKGAMEFLDKLLCGK